VPAVRLQQDRSRGFAGVFVQGPRAPEVRGGYKAAAAVAVGSSLGKMKGKMAGQLWMGSILLVVAAAQGMDKAAAAAVVCAVVAA
jgi:hypothetical protein